MWRTGLGRDFLECTDQKARMETRRVGDVELIPVIPVIPSLTRRVFKSAKYATTQAKTSPSESDV